MATTTPHCQCPCCRARAAARRKANDAAATSVHGRLVKILAGARTRARDKGLVFDIDVGWLQSLFTEQQGRCALTGIHLEFPATRDGGRYHPSPWTPSLHRASNSQGYTKANTLLVCSAINLGIGAFGLGVFERLARTFLARRRKGKTRRKARAKVKARGKARLDVADTTAA
jgi:hypothetical protein